MKHQPLDGQRHSQVNNMASFYGE